ncbi:OLC1v1035842C1 [Oldenlandia corymbosa var. corymbosa]|uniref:OLC1v1035842C1 n=1 Tax=Oldenlandia corymbosa var. corymbosa TaxID=529605 RepID=A0AAV1CX29_OLDCO|nr:OLC1v1035842C1 [Oldenlandia corymbosa var. corymbosa]
MGPGDSLVKHKEKDTVTGEGSGAMRWTGVVRTGLVLEDAGQISSGGGEGNRGDRLEVPQGTTLASMLEQVRNSGVVPIRAGGLGLMGDDVDMKINEAWEQAFDEEFTEEKREEGERRERWGI